MAPGRPVPPERLVPASDRRRTGIIAAAVSLVFLVVAYGMLRSGNAVLYFVGVLLGLWGMGGVAFAIKLILGAPPDPA